MKKAILFLVALILLSFISNAGIGNQLRTCKAKITPPAFLIYKSIQACSHFQTVSSHTRCSKAGLSIFTPASLNFALGIVAYTNKAILYSELTKLIPTTSNRDLAVLKTKHKLTCNQNICLTVKDVNYNYLPCLVKSGN